MEPDRKHSEAATTFDFWAPGQRWKFVDSFEREGVRYVVVSEEPVRSPSLLTLTRRERQIVAQAVLGSSNQQIAKYLGISHATVRVLMSRAANRLGVRTRKELLAHPALQEQSKEDAQAANGPSDSLQGSSLELAEQAVGLPTRTGTEE